MAIVKSIAAHGNYRNRVSRIKEPDFNRLFAVYDTGDGFVTDMEVARNMQVTKRFAQRISLFADGWRDVYEHGSVGIKVGLEPWRDFLYTPKQAGEVINKATGKGVRSIYSAIRNGEIPHYQFSRSVIRFRRCDIENYCNKILNRMDANRKVAD